ncbi:MAG: RluA family pseudouridine synthase [Chloracidobacterium sp.]|uniref:Pseudouridine synthase n=1 Tax=Chloracidobacterium validum TaxID=2821543 RepID=A0ABX8BCY6_9BACT|nr:RluA family pseudouridine synthase [Chloracidobacterium validum]QUW04564.1 RluA family pseudouridine synthase [Chloracidobacterium validum]
MEAEVIVPPAAHRQRLDEFVRAQVGDWPLAAIRRAVAEGQIVVNTQTRTAGWRLRAGDRVRWRLVAPRQVRVPVEAFTLPILHEDDFLLVVAKPAGMLTHPTPKERAGTLLNALLAHPAFTGQNRPMLLHRLDRDTSGIVMVAKNERGARAFAPLFQTGEIAKTYLALLIGQVTESHGLIDAPIGRAPFLWPRWRILPDGKPAQTRFTIPRQTAQVSLARFQPLTGRTHQLRIHAAHLGYPIVGDMVYGRHLNERLFAETGRRASRHLLHAAELELEHPIEQRRLHLRTALPDDFMPWLASIPA